MRWTSSSWAASAARRWRQELREAFQDLSSGVERIRQIISDLLPRLFEAFFTTKAPEKGTGLGLALSREFIEGFGGTLSAENRAEGGARLRITLPALARRQPEPQEPLVATTTL